jgi:hypothetical protein
LLPEIICNLKSLHASGQAGRQAAEALMLMAICHQDQTAKRHRKCSSTLERARKVHMLLTIFTHAWSAVSKIIIIKKF